MTESSQQSPGSSLVTICHITYGLHALGLAIGAFGAATVTGSFLFGWPSIIAVIINYVKRGDAQGTWLESHFAWQIRTFWFAFAWASAIGLIGFVLAIIVIGLVIWIVGFFAVGAWVVYRVAKGWLKLQAGKGI